MELLSSKPIYSRREFIILRVNKHSLLAVQQYRRVERPQICQSPGCGDLGRKRETALTLALSWHSQVFNNRSGPEVLRW